MGEENKNLIPYHSFEILNLLYSALSNGQKELIDQIKDEILSNLFIFLAMPDFRKPVEKVEACFLKKTFKNSQEQQLVLRRALVAKLALELPGLVAKMDLPASILALYPNAFERLADYLKNVVDYPYDSKGEFFCKDIRFVLGMSIPCGSLYIDMYSCVPFFSVILSALRSRDVKGIIRYTSLGGKKPWFRGHLDSRYTSEFNEKDFDFFYLRVAELLERQTHIKGYVGTSWLYDPQLLEISPHLAFFQDRPKERGAFSLKHGTQESDVVNAIKASETRRRLYYEGKYKPVCYSSLWPREYLISWAKQSRGFSTRD